MRTLRDAIALGTVFVLFNVSVYAQEIQNAFQTQNPDKTEEPSQYDPHAHCDHNDHTILVKKGIDDGEIQNKMLTGDDEKRRVVVAIQESLANQLGIDSVLTDHRINYLNYEQSLVHSALHRGTPELTELLETLTLGSDSTETLNVVKVVTIPDNMFPNTPIPTRDLLTQFSTPNDGYFPGFDRATFAELYNQEEIHYIVDNATTGNTSTGTATIHELVVPWLSTMAGGEVGGITKVIQHEMGHCDFMSHQPDSLSVLDHHVVIDNGGVLDTIAVPGDKTLDRGAGPFKSIFTEQGAKIAWPQMQQGFIDHPGLKIEAESETTTAHAGDFIVCDTEIHSSWANVAGLQVTITGPDGETLQSGIHDNTEAEWGIQVPVDAEIGPWTYTVEIYNEHTDETASQDVTITIEEEVIIDRDGDGVPDTDDIDNDNDGRSDADEQASALNGGDSDEDGILDKFDDDSDNDTVLDKDEIRTDMTGEPTIVPIGDDLNGNGMYDAYEVAGHIPTDTNEDGIANYIDPNDDGDPYMTIDEDKNEDGNPKNDDEDLDGIPDFLDDEFTTSTVEIPQEKERIKVYPNPTPGSFKLIPSTAFQDRNFTLTIFDITGKMVYQTGDQFYGSNPKRIDFNAPSSGMYTMSITNEGAVDVSKLVIH